MPDEPEEDITIRLAMAGLDPESVKPAEMEALLREAIAVINVLRAAARLREEVTNEVLAEIEPDDFEPEGNA